MCILEIGAGTGRYSHALARMGYKVAEMDEKTFDLYMKYQFCICEREDMVGLTNHMLDIFRKEK